MVAIPKVLSNKTVLTGLAQSSLKGNSLFAPVNGAIGKMGKVVGEATLRFPEIKAFTADMSAKTAYIPAALGRPMFVSKHTVSFR